MASRDRLVPPGSPAYREFVHLYEVVGQLRPTDVDRWNRELYATSEEIWGGFDPATGAIRLSEDKVLRHLTGTTPATESSQRAQALATVLHETTHARMDTDAPSEPNAVRAPHSLGLMEGIAEVRTSADFEAFTTRAGYPGLVLTQPQYPGAFAAAEGLIEQVTGPAKTPAALLDEATRGPGAMHFDQLADAVVRNRLSEVIPPRPQHQQAVRAALISTMTHAYWPTIKDRQADVGESLANEVRQDLNAKVEEIRHHYAAHPTQPFPAESPNPSVLRAPDPAVVQAQEVADNLRFLGGQAPAAGATRFAPSLGDGARGSVSQSLGRKAQDRTIE